MTHIEPNTVVSLRYLVKDNEGVTVDEGLQPLNYLHGDYDTIFPLIEEALAGKTIGHQIEVRLQPEDAFGLYQPELMKLEPRHLFPEDLAIGNFFEGRVAGGGDDVVAVFRVTDIGEETVIVDANHPLAGIELIFSGEVIAIRPATAQEIEQQQVII